MKDFVQKTGSTAPSRRYCALLGGSLVEGHRVQVAGGCLVIARIMNELYYFLDELFVECRAMTRSCCLCLWLWWLPFRAEGQLSGCSENLCA